MKEFPLPDIGRNRKNYTYKYESTVIANITVDTFTVEGDSSVHKRLSRFYAGMVEKFSLWVRSDFEAYARNAYATDADPRKKYRFIPFELCYKSDCKVENERFLFVDVTVTLSRKKKEIARKQVKHIRDLKNGRLISNRKKHEK